jgi:acetyl esterase/lipase
VAVSVKAPPAPCVPYGEHHDQIANLHLPARDGGPWPCVVLLHGGFWRTGWDRTLMTGLAVDLACRGIASWNIEYRKVGQEGGGWPGTFEDVAAAVDHLGTLSQIDTQRVVTCGHSAGGHLALWAAARHRLPPHEPGALPRVEAIAAVAQGAVCDLEQAWCDDLGNGAVTALLGSLADAPARLAGTSPAVLTPLGVPQLLVHGRDDEVVPIEQSRDYAARDPLAELVELEGADHFDVIDVAHGAWTIVTEWLMSCLDA